MFSVIIPVEAGEVFISISKENKLHLNRKVNIRGIENAKAKKIDSGVFITSKKVNESDFYYRKKSETILGPIS